jgi:hypothetical protein
MCFVSQTSEKQQQERYDSKKEQHKELFLRI